MRDKTKDLEIPEQIFICQNDGKMELSEMSKKLGVPQHKIKSTLEILKANGVFEQYLKMTDEDVKRKQDITVPLHFNSMAARLLEKQNFNKGYVGFEYWKRLIALMMYKPEYLKKSLNSEIYPIIARKTYTTVSNVESQLRYSLNAAMGKQKYTIVSFLSTMLNSTEEKKKNEEEKAIMETEENTTEMKDVKLVEDLNTVLSEGMLVKVPINLVTDYWYMKGYIDATKENNLKIFKEDKLEKDIK